jgi:hypothetical protein
LQVGALQIGASQIGALQVGVLQVGLTQVKALAWMFLSPLANPLSPLLDDSNVV